jgi:hypothetical protein
MDLFDFGEVITYLVSFAVVGTRVIFGETVQIASARYFVVPFVAHKIAVKSVWRHYLYMRVSKQVYSCEPNPNNCRIKTNTCLPSNYKVLHL